VVVGDPDALFDRGEFDVPACDRIRLYEDARQHRRTCQLVVQDMAFGIDEDGVAGAAPDLDGDFVRHRAAGHEKGGFVPQHFGSHLLQAIDGRVFTEHIIAHFRFCHRPTHFRRGLRHGIGS
jgi:hypothetical protein